MADKQVNIIVKAIDQVTGELRGMGDAIGSFGDKVKGIFAGLVAGGIGAALGGFFKDAIKEAGEAEDSVAKLDTVLHGIGLTYRQIEPELEAYLTTLQRTTRYSDEDGRNAFANLILITGDYRKSLELMTVAANVATARHIDMAAGAEIVGKASIGVTKGLGDLGVTTTNAAEAVRQLTTNTNGLAEAAGSTFQGRVIILNHLWEEFKEKIGAGIVGSDELKGSLGGLADTLVDLAEFAEKWAPFIGQQIDGAFNSASFAGKSVAWLINQFTHLGDLWDVFKTVLGNIFDRQQGTTAALEQLSSKGVVANNEFVSAMITGTAGTGAALAERSVMFEQHGVRVVTLTKEQLAELKRLKEEAEKAAIAAQKAYQKEIEDSTKLLYDTQLKAASEYVKAVEPFIKQQGDLWDAAVKAGKEGAPETQQAIERLGQAALEAGQKVADHTMRLADMRVKHDELKNPLQTTVDATGLLDKAEQDEALSAILNAEAHRLHWEAIKKDSEEIGRAFDKVAGLAGAFRGLDPVLDEVANGFATVAGGIADISRGIGMMATDPLGGLTAGIGGIVSMIGLFGQESMSARQVRLALEATTRALYTTAQTLGDLIDVQSPGSKVADIQSILTEFFAGRGGPLAGQMAAKGITKEDFYAIADAFGIDLRGAAWSNATLYRFFQMLGNLDTGIGTDFGSQLRNIQDIGALEGATPETMLQRILALVTGPTGSPYLASQFAGKSPQQILDLLPTILANRGNVGAAGLGGLNLQQFNDVLNLLASLIRSTGGTNSLTGNLQTGGLDLGSAFTPTNPLSGIGGIGVPGGGFPSGGGSTLPPIVIDNSGDTTIVINGGSGTPEQIGDELARRMAEQEAEQIRRMNEELAQQLYNQMHAGGNVEIAQT